MYEDLYGDLIDWKRVEVLMSHMHKFSVVAQIHLTNIERLELKVKVQDWLDSGRLSLQLGGCHITLIEYGHVYNHRNW